MSESDIALVASIDFREAENQVNTFVENTKKKLSTIMAQATKAGGSLSSAGGSRGGNAFAPAGTDSAYRPNKTIFDAVSAARRQFDQLNALERAFSDASIGWQRKVQTERERIVREWGRSEREEIERIADVQREKGQEALNFEKAVNEQRKRERQSYASMVRNLIDQQAADEKTHSAFLKAEAERIAAVQKDKATEVSNFEQAMLEQQKRERQSYATLLRSLLDEQAASLKEYFAYEKAEAERVAQVQKQKAEEAAAFEKAMLDQRKRERQSYESFWEKTLNEQEAAERAYTQYLKEEEAKRAQEAKQQADARASAEKAELDRKKALAREYTEFWKQSLAEQDAATQSSNRSVISTAAAKLAKIRAMGSATNTAKSLRNSINGGFDGLGMDTEQANLIAKLDDAVTKYTATVHAFGARSEEATRAATAWKTAQIDIRDELQRVTAAAREAAAATDKLNAAERATTKRDMKAINAVDNRELGIGQRIDRQITDPTLRDSLATRVTSSAGDATRAIRMYGADSLEAAKALAAWKLEATAVSGEIAKHGGLFKQLSANTRDIVSAIDSAGNSFGGFRRMLLNTQVALTALTAAFGFREIMNAMAELETFKNTMTAVSPTAQAAAENIEFLKKAGDALGFSYQDLGKSFSQFAAASYNAGANTEQIQQVFVRVTAAARNLGLSSADTDGMIRALTQSMSKGRFAAEEIRQQLGDRMPVAMAALQKATGKSGQELEDMMKKGLVTTSEFMIPFVEQLYAMSGGMTATEKASQGINAAVGRLKNSFSDLVEYASKGDFATGLMKGITSLADALKGDFAKGFVDLFGKVLTGLASGLTSLASLADQYLTPVLKVIGDNLDRIGAVATAAIGTATVAAFAAATRSVWGFTAALLANPLGAMAVLVTAAAAAMIYYKDTIITFGGESARVWDIFMAYLQVAWENTKAFGVWVSEGFTKYWSGSMMSITSMWETVVSVGAKAIDAVIGFFKALPEVANVVGQDIVAYFSAMGTNIYNFFQTTLANVSNVATASAAAVGAAVSAAWSGNFSGVGEAAGRAFAESMGKATVPAVTNAVVTGLSNGRIREIFATTGSTVAQDFVSNFGQYVDSAKAGLASAASSVTGAIDASVGDTFRQNWSRIMSQASERTRAWQAEQAESAKKSKATLDSLFTSIGGRFGDLIPPGTDKKVQAVINAVKEALEDLERSAKRAGVDGGAAQAYASAFNKIEDAASKAGIKIDTTKAIAEASIYVAQKLQKEYELFVKQSDRTAYGNERIAAGFRESAAAGQQAEIYAKAMTEAIRFVVPTTDEAGNATGKYKDKIEELIPVLTRVEKAQKNANAARQVNNNKDEIEQLQLSTRLITANAQAREAELAALKARQQNRGADPSYIAEAEASARALVEQKALTDQLTNSWQDLAKLAEQSFDRIGNAITEAFAKGKNIMVSFKSVAKAVFSEIVQAALKMMILNPILNALFGGTRGTAGGLMTVLSGGLGNSGSSGGMSIANISDDSAIAFATGVMGVEGALSPSQITAAKQRMVSDGYLGGSSGGGSSGGGLMGNLGLISNVYSLGSKLGLIPKSFDLGSSLGLTGDGGILTNAWNTASGWFNGTANSALGTGVSAGESAFREAAGLSSQPSVVSQVGSGVGQWLATPLYSVGGAIPGVTAAVSATEAATGTAAGFATSATAGGEAMTVSAGEQAFRSAAGLSNPGVVTIGQTIGGVAGLAGGAYGIYSGIQKGGIGGGVGVAGGVASMVGGASMLGLLGPGLLALGPYGLAIGAILAIASMFLPGQKPSNKTGTASVNVDTGAMDIYGQTGKKFSQQNRDTARQIAQNQYQLIGAVEQLTGGIANGNLTVNVGNRDGISARYETSYGVFDARGLNNDADSMKNLSKVVTIFTLQTMHSTMPDIMKNVVGTMKMDSAEQILTDLAKVADAIGGPNGATQNQTIASAHIDFSNIDNAITELKWVKDTFEKLIAPDGVQRMQSAFLKSLEDLDTQWKGLTDHAAALGLATDQLAASWKQATADLWEARNVQLNQTVNGVKARGLRATGGFWNNMNADLMEFDSKAATEKITYKKSLIDLGVLGDALTPYLTQLEEVQQKERAGIVAKYTTDVNNWLSGTYNVLTNKTNAYWQSLDSINSQYNTAIETAKQLGIAETDLVDARNKAITQAVEQRNANVNSAIGGLTSRLLRAAGGDANSQQADLNDFDLQAAQERISFKKTLTDLGMTTEEISAQMVRLEQAQGAERLAIIKKYTDAAIDAENQRKGAVQDMLNGIKDYVHNLRMGDSSPLSDQAKYDLALKDFNSVSAKAASGDWGSISSLKDYADTFINASRTYNGSGTTFVNDFDRAIAALEAVAETSPDTLTASFLAKTVETQTETLNETLIAVRDEIISLRKEVRQQSLTPSRVTE